MHDCQPRCLIQSARWFWKDTPADLRPESARTIIALRPASAPNSGPSTHHIFRRQARLSKRSRCRQFWLLSHLTLRESTQFVRTHVRPRLHTLQRKEATLLSAPGEKARLVLKILHLNIKKRWHRISWNVGGGLVPSSNTWKATWTFDISFLTASCHRVFLLFLLCYLDFYDENNDVKVIKSAELWSELVSENGGKRFVQ